MSRFYQVLGSGIVLLGVVHMATTFQAFDTLSGAAVWFFGAGIAMVLTGALNVLNAAYGQRAPGMRWTCRITNVVMTGFAVVAAVATRATVGEFLVIVGLVASATLLSLLPRAPQHPDEGAA